MGLNLSLFLNWYHWLQPFWAGLSVFLLHRIWIELAAFLKLGTDLSPKKLDTQLSWPGVIPAALPHLVDFENTFFPLEELVPVAVKWLLCVTLLSMAIERTPLHSSGVAKTPDKDGYDFFQLPQLNAFRCIPSSLTLNSIAGSPFSREHIANLVSFVLWITLT